MKVRIAVAVCSKGHWTSSGYTNMVAQGHVFDCLDCDCSGPGKEHIVWVEAEVTLPSQLEVKGKVSDE